MKGFGHFKEKQQGLKAEEKTELTVVVARVHHYGCKDNPLPHHILMQSFHFLSTWTHLY